MAKKTVTFACSSCGHETPRWMGRCPGCGEWNSLVEEQTGESTGRSARPGRRGRGEQTPRPVPLAEVQASSTERVRTGSDELDRVLGGGLVPGSIVLMGGAPGIGK